MNTPRLAQRWVDLHPAASLDASMMAYYRIRTAYSESFRGYHDFGHIDWLVRAHDRHFPEAPPRLERGIWVHDLICRPGRRDNEDLSAKAVAGIYRPLAVSAAKCRLIAGDVRSTRFHLSDDPIAQMLDDLDLLPLAISPQAYQVGTTRVRAEYMAVGVTSEQWRSGRLVFLGHMLEERESIFQTARLRRLYEAKAVTNLEHERSLYW